MPTDQNIIKANINDIIPSPYQPRKIFDEESIRELAISIQNYGILNPLLVRKISSGYEIIAGERRYRAAKMVGLQEIPIIIKNLSDKEAREQALIENIQRNNLNPIEEAESFKKILDQNNITQEDLSKKIGKSQSVISNKMRLLNLSQEVKDAILNGKISERHGRTLLKLTEVEQNQVLEQIINKKLSVKETEDLINKKSSKENIKSILNSIDIDVQNSNTFNDSEQSIKNKGEEKMNNNIGNFFPQMDNNPNLNNNLDNNTIMFNNSPITGNNILPSDTISFNNETTTVPLNTLNQQPIISTIPNMNEDIVGENIQQNPNNSNISIQNDTPNQQETENLNNNSIPSNQNPSNIPLSPLFTNMESTNSLSFNNNSDVTIPNSMPEPPLFSTSTLTDPASLNTPEPSNVLNDSISEQQVPPTDNTPLDKIKEFLSNLNNPNVIYKEYSNELENCIIISIKK